MVRSTDEGNIPLRDELVKLLLHLLQGLGTVKTAKDQDVLYQL